MDAALIGEIITGFSAFINRAFQDGNVFRVEERQSYISLGIIQARLEKEGHGKLHSAPIALRINQVKPVTFDHVSRHIRAQDVKAVSLNTGKVGDPSVEEWREFFQRHPGIETLSIAEITGAEGNKLAEVVRLLSTSPSGDGEQLGGSVTVLPRLRKLCIVGIPLDGAVDDVASVLFERRQAGLPVEMVEGWPEKKLSRRSMLMMQGRVPVDVMKFVQHHDDEDEYDEEDEHGDEREEK